MLPQHPSNSLNHLNSPVLNFEERSASCMTDQAASISTRPPLSDVSNTAVNIHSRMDLNEGDKGTFYTQFHNPLIVLLSLNCCLSVIYI